MKTWLAVPLLLLAAAAPLAAQSEAELKRHFEGRTVSVKLDMPATDDGVDVFPERQPPIDFSAYQHRIKNAGTALKNGESVLVTRVKVKDKLIEFQLGGGGFGTFGDDNSTYVYTPSASKTAREKNLEKEVRAEPDAAKKRRLQEELDALRKERERQDALLQTQAKLTEQARRDEVRQKALAAGSRFNIRYAGRVPASALTPQAVMQALAEYVDFSRLAAAPAGALTPAAQRPESAPRPTELRKGLTRAEAEALLGAPERCTDGQEGRLKVANCSFASGDRRVEALFVEGVLVRYSITSQ